MSVTNWQNEASNCGNVDVAKDATVDLVAERDIIGVSVNSDDDDPDNDVEGHLQLAATGKAELTAGRNNSYQNVILADAASAAEGAEASLVSKGTYVDEEGIAYAGSVQGNNAEVGANGKLSLTSDKGPIDAITVTAGEGSEAAISAKGDVSTGDVTTGEGAKLDVTSADGGFTADAIEAVKDSETAISAATTITADALKVGEGSNTGITAGGDNAIDDIDADENAKLALTSTNGGLTFTTLDAETGTTVDVVAKTGIVGDTLTGKGNADISLTTDGDINSASDYLVIDLPEDGSLSIPHVDDYYVMGIEATQLTDKSGRDQQGNEITGTDMGHLDGETVAAAIVSDDAAELAAWILDRIEDGNAADVVALLDTAAGDPIDDLVANKNADGLAAWLERQLDRGVLDDETVRALVASLVTDTDVTPVSADELAADLILNNDNLAAWITARLDADDPRATQLETLTEEELATLVASLITEEDLEAANDEARDAYIDELATSDNLAQWLVEHLDGQTETIAALDEAALWKVDDIIADEDADTLATWIENHQQAGTLDEQLLAGLVSDLLTEEDLAALEQEAWNNSSYPATDQSRVDDLRDLTIEVGESTGSAYVENAGDIKISQQTGVMTAGEIVSDYGNVELTTTDTHAGDIVGNEDENVNVQGGDVIITSAGGVDDLVIETGKVELTAIGFIENQTSGGVPTVAYDAGTGSFATAWNVDYDQVVNYDKEETGSLTVTASGDVDVTEKTGDLGINTIATNGTVELTGDSISDARTDGQTEPNITAEGVMLTATKGDIGSTDKPIELDTDGEGDAPDATVNAIANGNVNLNETSGDLRVGAIVAGEDASLTVEDGDLVDADTDDLISKLGELLEKAKVAQEQSDSAAESARLREDALQELLESAEDAKAKAAAAQDAANAAKDDAEQSRDKADEANAKAESAAQAAQNAQNAADAAQQQVENLATAEQDLNDATSAAETANAQLQSLKDAERALDEAIASSDEAAIADAQQALDDIKQQIADELDINVDEVTDQLLEQNANNAQTELNNAQQALDDIKRQIADDLGIGVDDVTDTMLENAAHDAAEAAEYARKAADEAREAAKKAEEKVTSDQRAADAAQDAADAAAQAADEAQNAYDQLKAEVDGYRQTADDKAAEAEAARNAAKDIQLKDDPSIITDGDLNITANNVGTDDNALSTEVGGQLNVNGNATGGKSGDVNVENSGDLTVGAIDADDDVKVAATGDVKSGNDDDSVADISAGTVSIHSVGNDVGAKDDPITVDTDSLDAYGENVYVKGFPDLTVDGVVAEKEADLSADGDINDTGNGAGVVAEKASVTAGGNIGSDDNPLDVNANDFDATAGGDADLNLTSPTTNVDVKAGGDVDIDSTGAVQGEIDGDTITITADGNIGSPEKPLEATLPNKGDRPSATSNYGEVWIKKLPAEYIVRIILNGGELDGVTGTITYVLIDGTVFVLPLPTRAGYRFLYWLGSIFYAGDEYVVTADHTFQAIWAKEGSGSASTSESWFDSSFGGSYASRIGAILPKTGDELNAPLLALLLLVGVNLLALGVATRRKNAA